MVLFEHIKGLLTEREVCTIKCSIEDFSTDQASVATKVRYFTVPTEQAASINCSLYG